MAIYFISDLHLDEKFPDSLALFINFFKSLPNNTQGVYILGDLFEAWIGDNLNTPFLDNIKYILATYSKQIPIYFVRGNRDFLIGETFAKQTNITILPDLYKVNLYNYSIILTHGDLLCTLDKRHTYFTKIIRHPIIRFIANNVLSIGLKLMIAKQLRKISQNRYKNFNLKQKSAIYNVCQTTIEKVLQKQSANFLIHGHTHEPNIYNFTVNNVNYTRIVLGSWEKSAQILVLDPNGYQLKTITLSPEHELS